MDWIYWVVNLASVTVVGIIGYLIKREFAKNDDKQRTIAQEIAQLRKDVANGQAVSEERIKQEIADKMRRADFDMQKLTDRVNDMVRDIPRQYVAKEDWMINNQSIDRKLDRIMEILMKGAGGTTNG